MAKLEILEESVLRWPDGCDRTRIKERKSKAAWKFPWASLLVKNGDKFSLKEL